MSIDELRGMAKAFNHVKSYCERLDKTGSQEGTVYETMHVVLDSVIKHCDTSIGHVEESIDGEIERMHEIMEGKEDDRQDHRDV